MFRHTINLYRNSSSQNQGQKKHEAFDIWKILNTHGAFVPGIDASYGSAAYLPMADGASYQLSLGYNGLTAKPVNEIAKDAVVKWKQILF